jgi:hypothetical protein
MCFSAYAMQQAKPESMFRSMDPNGQAFMNTFSDGMCKNCTILAAKSAFTFEDGSDAGPDQGIYIHHVVSRDISKKPTLPLSKCGRGQSENSPLRNLGSEFVVHGEDGAAATILFTSKDGTYMAGFRVGPNDNFMHQIDLVNYKPETRNVYMSYEIEYVDGHVGMESSAGLLSVTGCQDPQASNDTPRKTINLSKTGAALTESPEFTMLADGKIIAGCESIPG